MTGNYTSVYVDPTVFSEALWIGLLIFAGISIVWFLERRTAGRSTIRALTPLAIYTAFILGCLVNQTLVAH
jgi:hypothetical protein